MCRGAQEPASLSRRKDPAATSLARHWAKLQALHRTKNGILGPADPSSEHGRTLREEGSPPFLYDVDCLDPVYHIPLVLETPPAWLGDDPTAIYKWHYINMARCARPSNSV